MSESPNRGAGSANSNSNNPATNNPNPYAGMRAPGTGAPAAAALAGGGGSQGQKSPGGGPTTPTRGPTPHKQQAGPGQAEFGLNKLNPAGVKPDSVCVFIGKRNTGKTQLVLDVIYHKRHSIPAAIIFSPTEAVNKDYQKHIPDSFIYDELDLEALTRAVERQKLITTNPPPWMADPASRTLLVVLDDCMAEEKKKIKDKVIKYIFKMGRHNKIFLMINIQYPKDLPPEFRMNIDYIFALKEENMTQRKALWDLLGGFSTFAEFNQVFEYYTNHFGCLIANRIEHSNEVQKKIFWYRATEDKVKGPWHCGDGMWNMHRQHYIADESSANRHDWTVPQLAPPFLSQQGSGAQRGAAGGAGGRRGASSQPFVLHRNDEHGNVIEEDE